MNIPDANIKEYIGDGVYVNHDGYHLWLQTLENEEGRKNEIALEPDVFQKLVEYAEKFGSYFTGKEKVL